MISEMPEAGALVSHDIQGAGEVIMACNIAVMALMQGLEAEEIGSGAISSSGAFGLPVGSRGIVM